MKQQRATVKKLKKEALEKKQRRNPPRISVGWGRAGSQYRPGIFAKQYLIEHGKACCAEIFRALKDDLRHINVERAEIGERPIRGGTYNSFAKYWHWFKLSGLIEPTGDTQQAIYDFLQKKRSFRLTSRGIAEEEAWQDPLRAAHPEFG